MTPRPKESNKELGRIDRFSSGDISRVFTVIGVAALLTCSGYLLQAPLFATIRRLKE